MGSSRIALLLFVLGLSACDAEGAPSAPDGGSGPGMLDASDGRDAGPVASPDAGPAPADGGLDAAAPDAQTPDAGSPPVEVLCDEVVEGRNTVTIGERERHFWVRSPEGTPSAPLAAVFWFHGFSGPRAPEEDARNDAALLDELGIHPDADRGFPFVRVLLEDTNLQPFQGLDWDIRTDEPNIDVALFDAVLECVVARRGVARDRVFAGGFSAGATILNLLHSVRGDVLRAVYTASGLWINEPSNLDAARRVTILPSLVAWDWPELPAVPRGEAAVLLSYGGANDNVPGTPARVSLTDAGRAAAGWLLEHGRVVVECAHDGGHTLHPGLRGDAVLGFFAAHVGTGASPWLGDAPPLPAGCTLRRP